MYPAIHIPYKIFEFLTRPDPRITNHESRLIRPRCRNRLMRKSPYLSIPKYQKVKYVRYPISVLVEGFVFLQKKYKK